eukprot:m.214244 g.214244  ORF g.214244 m.214244 type:complete len:560 (-) comp17190_c0_seq1:1572-3251(-)
MSQQPLLPNAYPAPIGSNEDGFETHITNVRAAFHNLRLRANRLLALLCLFDVLFSFITWALVSQGFHGDFKKNYIAESVLCYRFDRSLFDVICVAAFRSILLITAYWVARARSSVFMVFAVAGSTCFTLAKVFYYGFADSSQHPSDYMVIFVTFIMPWAEAYIWLSRIAPLNRKLALLYGETTAGVVHPSDVEQMLIEERHVLSDRYQIHPNSYGAAPAQRAYRGLTPNTNQSAVVPEPPAPVGPPEFSTSNRGFTDHRVDINEGEGDSDLEDLTLTTHRHRSQGSDDHSPFSTPPSEPSEYFETRSQASSQVALRPVGSVAPTDLFFANLAQQALSFVSEHARLDDSLWRIKEADRNGVMVHSIVKAEGPVYRSQGLIFTPPEQLFRFLYDRFENIPEWSRTWSACKVLRRIEKHTDMVYWATSDHVRQIGKRDMTEVRQWMHHDGDFTLGFASIKVPTVPPKRTLVRAVDRSSGFYLQRVRGTRMTKLTWIVNIDFKANSWLGGQASKTAVPRMMVDFTEEIRAAFDKKAQLHQEAGPPPKEPKAPLKHKTSNREFA